MTAATTLSFSTLALRALAPHALTGLRRRVSLHGLRIQARLAHAGVAPTFATRREKLCATSSGHARLPYAQAKLIFFFEAAQSRR